MIHFLIVAIVLIAAPAWGYVGVEPEPVYPGVVSYGSGNHICAAHPTKWVTARLWAGRPICPNERGARWIPNPCVYCDTPGHGDCPDQYLMMHEKEPGRQWTWRQGGPCPPGTSADVNGTAVLHGGWYWTTYSTGAGCNSGPDLPANMCEVPMPEDLDALCKWWEGK